MHFKVELCFELVIHPPKVLISSLFKVEAATLGRARSAGGWGGDQLSQLGLQIWGFMGTKAISLRFRFPSLLSPPG